MRFGSVCSGIEAASVAWHPLGWQAAWVSEIEPFPCAVLAHHYPEVPNHGDMTRLPALIRSGEVEAPDLFCGGTPCQAFSVAGLRKSLGDARGNLSLTFCEIADAIDHARSAGGKPASIVFWENVPGVLSTADNAFGCFLGALAGCDTAIEPLAATGWTDAGVVAGPVRSVAWRVLDAQYFGLAQRRRRVFVVASSRDGFDPAAVLLEWDGVRRDSAPSREAGEGVAGTFKACASSGGWSNSADHAAAGYMQPVVGTIGCNTGPNGHGFGDFLNNQAVDAGHIVAHSLRGEGFDASEDGTGRGTPLVPVAYTTKLHNTQSNQAGKFYEEYATSLDANSPPPAVLQPYTLAIRGRGDSHNLEYRQDGTANALLTPNGGRGGIGVGAIAQPVPFDTTQITSAANYSNPKPGDPCHPLAAGAHPPAVAFHPTQDPISSTEVCHAIGTGNGQGCATAAVAFDTYNQAVNAHTSQTIKSPQGAVQESVGTVLQAMQVRRLTPVECERLQGFPDHYTAIPWRGKPAAECPDGPRYKALGNSWAVPVVRWIGERISAVTTARKSAPPTRGSRC